MPRLSTLPTSRQEHLPILYALGLLFTLHLVIPVYINSSYLASLSSERTAGLAYSLGSILAILLIFFVTHLLPKVGNYASAMALVVLDLLALAGLVFTNNFYLVALFFLIHFVTTSSIALQLDVFLEHYSSDGETGKIRGTYLTLINLAWVIAPAIAGFILAEVYFERIYAAAVFILIPFILLLLKAFKNFRDPVYPTFSIKENVKKLRANKDVFNIFLVQFLLRIFFALMVVYTPIYLHNHIGFNFQTIGLLFTIMLSAYVLLEIPLGKLADSRFGEKEFLIAGFIIISASTAVLSFVTSTSFILWAALLFATRVGAALVDVMSETYFFKKTESNDIGDMSFFRATRPGAYLLAPLLATPFLAAFSFNYIFLAIAILMLPGILIALKIRDTR